MWRIRVKVQYWDFDHGTLITADCWAEIFHVNRKTILRDGDLAHAVDRIVEQCGPDARDLILAPGSKFTWGRVIALEERSPKEQTKIMDHLRFHGKLPRWFKVSNGPPMMTVPREPVALAEAIARRFNPEEIQVFRTALGELSSSRLRSSGGAS